MRAAVSKRYGPPDVVQVLDVPEPRPGDDDLLVEVHATTVNRTDCHYRSGRPLAMHAFAGWLRPKATVLGTEYAGIVRGLGASVEGGFSLGDKVFGWIEGRFGAHAEFLVARAGGPVAKAPEGRSLHDAAALTEGTHYALNALRKLKVANGTDLLVYGATGSIGTAAVQLAKSLGASVTAVGGTSNLDLLRSLGADRVVDYQRQDVLADTARYDAILDSWGHASCLGLRRLLRPTGSYSSTGAGAHKEVLPLTLAAPLMRTRKVLFAYPRIDHEMVRGFATQYENGEYRPVIDRRYSLEDIVEAYRYVEEGQKVGNVVVRIREE